MGNVRELPLNGGTCAPRKTLATHAPTAVPANGAETPTDSTGPSGEKVMLAVPAPVGPSGRLQAIADDAAEFNAESAARRLSGGRSSFGGKLGGSGGGTSGSSGRTEVLPVIVVSFSASVATGADFSTAELLWPARSALLISSALGVVGTGVTAPAVGKLSMFTPVGPAESSRAAPLTVARAVVSVVVISGMGAGRCVTQKIALAAAESPPIAANSGKKPDFSEWLGSKVCGRGVPVRELENCDVLIGGSDGSLRCAVETPDVERSGAAD